LRKGVGVTKILARVSGAKTAKKVEKTYAANGNVVAEKRKHN